MKHILGWLKQNRKLIGAVFFMATFLVLTILICVYMMPFIRSLSDPTAREAFKARLSGFGVGKIFIMLGIQILQVIIAFIPGEPVEILMGVMFGTWGGLIVSLIGIMLASGLVFWAIHTFGQPLFEVFFDVQKMKNFKFLNNTRNAELLIFILFFIPGTPKDLLTYFVPLTNIKLLQFLLISTFARIPSIITSTYAGSSLIDGDLTKTVIAFAITAILGLAGILINNMITKRHNKEENT